MIVIANWPAARQEHWDALLRARAIENQCFVIGVNRTGVADGLSYDGGSRRLRSVGRAHLADAGALDAHRDDRQGARAQVARKPPVSAGPARLAGTVRGATGAATPMRLTRYE